MVTFLLKTQDKQGRWRTQGRRPPLEESSVAVTVLAVRGMQQYVGKSQKTDVDKAIARAKSWLADVKPQSQEDRNMLLWSVKLIGGEKTKLAAYRKDVLKTQQPDGGWSQKPGMKSDAYATGQTVFVLLQTGLLPTSPAVRKGLAYLSKTQQQDGSWFVKTRSKPVQKYFDNGDPHGKSQFISISATAWATAALADSMKRVDASTK